MVVPMLISPAARALDDTASRRNNERSTGMKVRRILLILEAVVRDGLGEVRG
jgi:hypothetical protein